MPQPRDSNNDAALSTNDTSLTTERLLQLQRTIGNRGVNSLLSARVTTVPTRIRRRGTDPELIDAAALDLAGAGSAIRAAVIKPVLKKYLPEQVRPVIQGVPGVMRSTRTLYLCMDFVGSGGSVGQVGYAFLQAGRDDDLLEQQFDGEWLTSLAESSMGRRLTAAQITLLDPFKDDLLADSSALTRVCNLILATEDDERSLNKIHAIKEFDYNPDLLERAETQAKLWSTDVFKRGTQEINEQETTKRSAALQGSIPNPSVDERKKLKKKLKTDDKITAHLREQGKKNAEGAVRDIGEAAERDRSTLQEVTVPAAFQRRKGEYLAFYRSVSFYPRTIEVLDCTGNDLPLAKSVIDVIVAEPTTSALLIDARPTRGEIRTVLTLSATEIAAGLVKISPDEFKQYAQKVPYITLLAEMLTAGTAGTKVKALTAEFVVLQTYIADDTARGHLITLVGLYSVKNIRSLLGALPPVRDVSVPKMGALVALRPKAVDTAALMACLALCGNAGWDLNRILAVVGVLPNGRSLVQLKAAVHVALSTEFDPTTRLQSWVNTIGLLVTEGYATVTCGPFSRLPNRNSNAAPTDEATCTVTETATSTGLGSFVCHRHPGVAGASVGSAYASKEHLKLTRHTTLRIYRESIPASIWSVIKPMI